MNTYISTNKSISTDNKFFNLLLGLGVFIFGIFFLLSPSDAFAAVAYDAGSESHTGTTGSVSSTTFSWTHTPSGTPAGVLVFVFTNANADYISSVTYGGVAMTRVSGGQAIDTTTEAGRTDTFFLGSSITSGAQTVLVNRTNNATEMYATAMTVTGASNTELYTAGIVLLQNNQILVQQAVTDGSTGINSVRFAGVNSGLAAVPTEGASSTLVHGIDFGTRVIQVVRETTAGQGSRNVGFDDNSSDDVAAVHLAIREIPPIVFSGVLYTDAGSTTAASGKTIKVAVGTSTPSIHTATTTSGGAWSFSASAFTSATSGTSFTIWLDGDASDATTLVTGFSSTTSFINIPLYYNYLVSHGSSTADTVTLSKFAFYDSTSDADILYTAASTAATTTANLFIKQGIFVPTATLSIAGNYQNNATFTGGSGTLTFTGTSKTIAGTLTAASSFNNLVIAGSATVTAASAVATNLTINSGGTLTAPAELSLSGNYQNSGTFLANSGEVNFTGTSKTLSGTLTATSSFYNLFISGTISVTPSTASTTNLTIYSGGDFTAPTHLTISGNFQNQGTFDNNNGTMYVENAGEESFAYVAGRDSSGNSGGTGGNSIYSLTTVGNYLYVGYQEDGTACSQTAGSAQGCELKVYDISSSTNPIYVAGRDASGNSAGTGGNSIYSLTTVGNYLYVGQSANTTACSQTAGSAEGCELKVYDISSSTNPIYVAGRDASGDSTGTGVVSIASLTVKNNYLYVGYQEDGTACSQTAGSAEGCELKVYDISSSTNPIYVAGRDSSGDSTGVANSFINSLTTVGNYLYVGQYSNATACSQTAGSAIGCELQVYDISSGVNPIYVAGRDASGNSAGTGGNSIYSLTTVGNYLYVGHGLDSTACSQTAGSAQGCELKVYDISSSTNPVYVAGRDASGNGTGTAGGFTGSLFASGNHLYIGMDGTSIACSQTAGSAEGCELQVYDISSSTNPFYLGGKDYSGSSSGYYTGTFSSLVKKGDYLYIATGVSNSIACSQTAGSAEGCELQVYDTGIAGVVSGNLTAANDLGNIKVNGFGSINSNATTSNLIIESGTTTLPTYLTIKGDYQNSSVADFSSTGRLYFDSTSAQSIGGALTEGSAFPNTTFIGSGTKTIIDIASTSDFVINSGAEVVSTETLEIKGNFTNAGEFTPDNLLFLKGDYANSGNFNHNNGLVEAGAYLGNYVAGLDGSGGLAGTSSSYSYFHSIFGNYLYVGRGGDSTACSQTAGSVEGCELQVYNISSSTNPVYVAGRDISGSSSGTGDSAGIVHFTNLGNYLYVAAGADPTACSQTAGSAIGCELQVYDISSSTNPVYVAGRDASGSSSGTFGALYNTLIINGNYLYVGKGGDTTACSQTAGSAEGCELQVYDISSSTNPVYVAGRDASGSSSGVIEGSVFAINILGNFLYISKGGDTTACSQTAGSAEGCELQVYDISSSTNPVYVAGRDASGSSSGVEFGSPEFFVIKGTILYIASYGAGATICTQTAGSATGCELQVYDISSSTNPVYVAGRDASGSSSGMSGDNLYSSLFINNNYLYTTLVNFGGQIPACSQTAGSAIGCELQVYDISSSTNPVYVAGRDSSGSSSGIEGAPFTNMVINGYYIYTSTGSGSNSTPCSQTAGSAQGCELQIYSLTPTFSGGMETTDAFADLTVAGIGVDFANDATADDLVIEANATLLAPTELTVGGDFDNGGTFDGGSGTVVLTGTNQNLTGTTTFYHLTKVATAAATTTFEVGSLTTVEGSLTFSGLSNSVRHVLRSGVSGEDWYLDPQATSTLTNLSVKDSNNINATTVVCSSGCLDGTGNTNWSFIQNDTLSSATTHQFYVGQATTTLGTIAITIASTATAANDLRLSIATTTSNFRFDTSTTNLTFGGTAAGKVSSTVSYADGAATLVIDVTTNFAAEDTLTIAGVAVGSFATVSTTSSNFALHTDGNATGTPSTLDTQNIYITGSLLASNHTAGQVSNTFSFQNKNDTPLFAFNLVSSNEGVTVNDLVISLNGIQSLDSTKISDFKLYRDNNSDGLLDGSDLLIDAAGVLTLNSQMGAVTFSTDFVATTSANYLMTGDTSSILSISSTVVRLLSIGITATGNTSAYFPHISSSVTSVQHARNGSSGGGSSARIGDAAPAGAGVVTGGGSGGGVGAGGNNDGENIAADNNYFRPTATGGQHNEWTNGSNALASDGVYATAASTNLRQSYTGFAFGIPTNNTIKGIAVKVDASGTTAAGTIDVAISWDGGSSYTTAKATPTLVGTDIVYSVGGAADTWGRSWTASEFSTNNFILRVTAQPSSNTLRLDALEIRVYHQTGGGGAGGGGGI